MTHAYRYAEVAPLAPALPAVGEGLAALFPLLLWMLALSLLIIWRHTVGALLEHLANLLNRVSIPTGFGHVRPLGFVASGLQAADFAVQQVLSVSAKATERAAVYLFHKSLATFEEVGRELYRLAEDTVRAVQLLERHSIPRLIAQALIPPLAAIAAVRTLAHVIRVELRHDAARLRSQIHTIAHATTVALPREIARVGGRVGRLEHDLEAESARVKRLAELATLAGFSAFMWRWMGRYGLRWLRCPSLARIGSRIGCGGFGLLEDLLALSFTALALSDICAFAGAMTSLAEWYRPLLMDFVDVEDALIGCHGATKPDPLDLPRLWLPPVPDPLPLG